MTIQERKQFGEEEFGILYPTFIGGPPDRAQFSDRPELRTLEFAEQQRQIWLDRGVECYVISRKWRIV